MTCTFKLLPLREDSERDLALDTHGIFGVGRRHDPTAATICTCNMSHWFNIIFIQHFIYYSKFEKTSRFDFCFQCILVMEYPKFFYRHVAQPLRYKREEIGLRFLLAFFAKLKIHQNTPKMEIVTDGYKDLLIFVCPHLLLHFTPK